jgi:hypothetical protein
LFPDKVEPDASFVTASVAKQSSFSIAAGLHASSDGMQNGKGAASQLVLSRSTTGVSH